MARESSLQQRLRQDAEKAAYVAARQARLAPVEEEDTEDVKKAAKPKPKGAAKPKPKAATKPKS